MSSDRSQSWLIDRRHVLCALGCCISLPMLECMIPLRATVSAAGWESGEPPLKLLFDTDIGANIDGDDADVPGVVPVETRHDRTDRSDTGRGTSESKHTIPRKRRWTPRDRRWRGSREGDGAGP